MTGYLLDSLVRSFEYISSPFLSDIEVNNDPIEVVKVPSSKDNEPVWALKTPFPSCPCEGEVSTVDELLKRIVTRNGVNRALGYRKVLATSIIDKNGSSIVKKRLADDYTWFTHEQLDDMIDKVSHGLLISGVKFGDRVTILMESRYEWFVACQAILRIGATLATLYSTLNTQSIVIAMNELEAKYLITSSDLLGKIDRIRSSVSTLTTVIVVDNQVDGKADEWPVIPSNVTFVSFASLMNGDLGRSEEPLEKPDANSMAVIMYTSGSTGAPKGVIYSHASLLAGVFVISRACTNVIRVKDEDEKTFLSFLPLAHILQFVADLAFLNLDFMIGYSSPSTLLSSSPGLAEDTVSDIQLLKPLYIPCVPIMLDRIRMTVTSMIEAKGLAGAFHSLMDYKARWNALGKSTPLVDRLFTCKIKAIFGGNLKGIIVGGAPLSRESKLFMSKAGFSVMEAYGSTESVGHGIMDIPRSSCLCSGSGYPMPGAHIKLVDWQEGGYCVTDSPNPRGEVIIGAKSIAQGYFKQPEKTAEEFYEQDGLMWWRSGDIGQVMPDGSITIIDRKKDLIKLSRGEYVSLSRIESAIKLCPPVANVCVYGAPTADYLVALVVPNEQWLQQTMQHLHQNDQQTISAAGDTSNAIHSNEEVTRVALEQIQSCLKKTENFSQLEIPSKVKLCSESWTPESGLVTAALKIRRKQIVDFYRESLDQMYSK